MHLKIHFQKVSFLLILFAFSWAYAGQVEVLHWWTSAGEAKSANVLKKLLEDKGHTWKDFAVAGGGGENAMTVLKTRVVSGNAPTAAQIKGPAIQEWAELGVTANLDKVAKTEEWEKRVYPEILKHMQYNKHYVAVPLNVHRVNWLWINPKVFKKANVKIPSTWDEFKSAAQQLDAYAKKNNLKDFTAVAHGGQNWQDATVFEAIVISVGGSKFYQDALVDLKKEALTGTTMQKVFDQFRDYQKFTDKGNSGRDWNQATAMVINGKAGMQIMGDWAKGEFIKAGKKYGEDYLCIAVPGTEDSFTYNTDSFVMFKTKNPEDAKAQDAMATLILSPEFQTSFNLNKGSAPVRKDIRSKDFDACTNKSIADIASTRKKGGFVPSMAHNMSTTPAVQGAIFDVVTQFFNSKQTGKEAAEQLYKSVIASR